MRDLFREGGVELIQEGVVFEPHPRRHRWDVEGLLEGVLFFPVHLHQTGIALGEAHRQVSQPVCQFSDDAHFDKVMFKAIRVGGKQVPLLGPAAETGRRPFEAAQVART